MAPRLPLGVTRHTDPLTRPKSTTPETPTDWLMIGAIAAAIIGGLIAGLAAACVMGYFPRELLGGPLGTGVTFFAGAAILLPAAMILFEKWYNPESSLTLPACTQLICPT